MGSIPSTKDKSFAVSISAPSSSSKSGKSSPSKFVCKPYHKERVLILGTSHLAQQIVGAIEDSPGLRSIALGLVSENSNSVHYLEGASPPTVDAQSYPVLGTLDDLDAIVKEVQPNRIIVALTELRGKLPVRDLLYLRTHGVQIEDGIEVYERLTGKLAIESLRPSYLLFSRDFERSKWQMRLRRVVSICAALIGLLVFAPIMLCVATAIKLDSRGPVFFIQERVGLGGQIFKLIKFRTMHPMPDRADSGSVWSRNDGPRITRVGKWLRKFHLDEPPQFINILRGDMDLVGPRPEMASNVETMTQQIPYYVLRTMVRPGITGWAQVMNGYAVAREEVTEKMRYDLYYIKRLSPWLDFRILVKTIGTIASRFRSKGVR